MAQFPAAGNRIPLFRPLFVKCACLEADLGEFVLDSHQPGARIRVIFLDEGDPFDLELLNATPARIKFSRKRFCFHPEPGRSLINKVYGLVREKSIRNVPLRHRRRRYEGCIADSDPMVRLEPLPKSAEDAHRVRNGGFLHRDRLEPPLERRILFNMLAVLVQGRRANAMQRTPREKGLQEVRCIDRPVSTTGAYNHV